jgi:hypothetical protein
MLNWIYSLLVNRRNIAPDLLDGTTCGVPGCSNPAVDQWCPAVCALRNAGVKSVWVPVCEDCDAKANEMTVRFFFGAKYEAELTAYREGKDT